MESRKYFTKAIATSDAAYSDLDQIGVAFEIPKIAATKGQALILESLTVIDKAKQASALVIFFFSKLPTVASVDNAALNITNAEMEVKCIGKLDVASADYKTTANCSVATKANIQLHLPPQDDKSGETLGQSIYAIVMSNGTPDYTLGTDLILKMGFKQ